MLPRDLIIPVPEKKKKKKRKKNTLPFHQTARKY